MDQLSRLINHYKVMVHEVDFNRRLKLSSAFNYFQEIAGLHSDKLGIGMNTIHDKFGVMWVLTRIRVEIERYPVWDEEIIIETWPQLPGKLEFERDYIMKDLQGCILMRAVSKWVVIDSATRELRKSSVLPGEYPELPTERAIQCTLGKLRPNEKTVPVYKRRIGGSDIDMNGHLNNAKYIDFIMDCFSMENLRKYQARSIQVNYQNEVMPGETIELLKDSSSLDQGRVYIEGVNEEKGNPVFACIIEIA